MVSMVTCLNPFLFMPPLSDYPSPESAFTIELRSDEGEVIEITDIENSVTGGHLVITANKGDIFPTDDGYRIDGPMFMETPSGVPVVFNKTQLSVDGKGNISGMASLPNIDIEPLKEFRWSDDVMFPVSLKTGSTLKEEGLLTEQTPVQPDRLYMMFDIGSKGIHGTGLGDVSIDFPGFLSFLPLPGLTLVFDPLDPSLYLGLRLGPGKGIFSQAAGYTKDTAPPEAKSAAKLRGQVIGGILDFLDGFGMGVSVQGLIPFTPWYTWGLDGYGRPLSVNTHRWYQATIPIDTISALMGFPIPVQLTGNVAYTDSTQVSTDPDAVRNFAVNGTLTLKIPYLGFIPFLKLNDLAGCSIVSSLEPERFVTYFSYESSPLGYTWDFSMLFDPTGIAELDAFKKDFDETAEPIFAEIANLLSLDSAATGNAAGFLDFRPDDSTADTNDSLLDYMFRVKTHYRLSPFGFVLADQIKKLTGNDVSIDLDGEFYVDNTQGLSLSGTFDPSMDISNSAFADGFDLDVFKVGFSGKTGLEFYVKALDDHKLTFFGDFGLVLSEDYTLPIADGELSLGADGIKANGKYRFPFGSSGSISGEIVTTPSYSAQFSSSWTSGSVSYDFVTVKGSLKLTLSTAIGTSGASYSGKVTGSYSDPTGYIVTGKVSEKVSVSVSSSGVKCSVSIPIINEKKSFTFD